MSADSLPKPKVTIQTVPQSVAILQKKEEMPRDKKRSLKGFQAPLKEIIESTPPEFIPKEEGVEVVSYALQGELWRRAEFFVTKALPTAAVYATLAVAVGCENQEFMRQLNVDIAPHIGGQINIATPVVNAFVTGLLAKEWLRPFSRFNEAAEKTTALRKIAEREDPTAEVVKVIARQKDVSGEKVGQWLAGNVDKKDGKNPQVQLVLALRNKELLQLEEAGVPAEEREAIANKRVVEAYKTMQELAKQFRSSDEFKLKRVRETIKDVALPTLAATVGTEAVQQISGPVMGALAGLVDDGAAGIYAAKKTAEIALPKVKEVIVGRRKP